MAQQRDNIKAGVFVLFGIVLAVVVVFTLSDFERIFEKRQKIAVYYQLTDGLLGLKDGAPITLGDVPIGEVTKIRDVTQAELEKMAILPTATQPVAAKADPSRVVGKLVSASIPKRYQIYQNAVVELNAPPLGSGTKLNIRSVGTQPPYTGDKPLVGQKAGSALMKDVMAEAGIGDFQREQIRDILDNVNDLTAALSNNQPRDRHLMLPGDRRAAELREAMLKLSETVAKLPALVDEAKQAVADAKAALEDARAITADARGRSKVWFDRLDGVTKSADESLARVNVFLKDKEPELRDTVSNVHEVTRQAKEKTMVQVTELLDKANASLDDVKAATGEVKGFAVGQRPVLERMLANFTLASDQLKLASIEVRRSPWRLLYTPGNEEIAADNIYDAARSFALAAGALDSATRSLATVAQKSPDDKEQIQKMIEHLQALFARYQEAEDTFWKALKHGPGPGTAK